MLGTEKKREQEKEGEKQRESGTLGNILYVQEVVTHFILVTYYIKGVTTSWTYSNYYSSISMHSLLTQSVLDQNFSLLWLKEQNIKYCR